MIPHYHKKIKGRKAYFLNVYTLDKADNFGYNKIAGQIVRNVRKTLIEVTPTEIIYEAH